MAVYYRKWNKPGDQMNEKLNEAERAWMIYQLGYQLWQDAEESVSDGVENVIQQAQSQVSNIDKLGLIQALVEQIKGG